MGVFLGGLGFGIKKIYIIGFVFCLFSLFRVFLGGCFDFSSGFVLFWGGCCFCCFLLLLFFLLFFLGGMGVTPQ